MSKGNWLRNKLSKRKKINKGDKKKDYKKRESRLNKIIKSNRKIKKSKRMMSTSLIYRQQMVPVEVMMQDT